MAKGKNKPPKKMKLPKIKKVKPKPRSNHSYE